MEIDRNCEIYDTSKIKGFSTESGKDFQLFDLKMDNKSDPIQVFANQVIKGGFI